MVKRLALSSVVLAIAAFLSSCAAPHVTGGELVDRLVSLERESVLDEDAGASCAESISGAGPIVAAGDSNVGEVRRWYEGDVDVFDPGQIRNLPSDDSTFAAICIYEATDVRPGSDRAAYWVSHDGERGGAVLIALWNSSRQE